MLFTKRTWFAVVLGLSALTSLTGFIGAPPRASGLSSNAVSLSSETSVDVYELKSDSTVTYFPDHSDKKTESKILRREELIFVDQVESGLKHKFLIFCKVSEACTTEYTLKTESAHLDGVANKKSVAISSFSARMQTKVREILQGWRQRRIDEALFRGGVLMPDGSVLLKSAYVTAAPRSAQSWAKPDPSEQIWPAQCNRFINQAGNYGDFGKRAFDYLGSKWGDDVLNLRDVNGWLCPKFKNFSKEQKKDFFVYVLMVMSFGENRCIERGCSAYNTDACGLFQLHAGKSQNYAPLDPTVECSKNGGSISVTSAYQAIPCTIGMIRDYASSTGTHTLFAPRGKTYWHVLWLHGSEPGRIAQQRIMSYPGCR